MDTDTQAGLKGLRLAGEKNIPVVIMEPVKGGSLANVSEDVKDVFEEFNNSLSVASWALRYVASFDEVMTVLSGMSNFEQVKDNIKTFTDFKALNEEELSIVQKAKDLIISKTKSACTGCRYCMPCPKGVNIPLAFRTWNSWSMYNKNPWTVSQYKNNIKEEGSPLNCIDCGKCENLCPQKINIREDLKKVAKDFEL
jgi:predicted aldo/keto reductase-like oxidoreductase